jgi:hypothetical protein
MLLEKMINVHNDKNYVMNNWNHRLWINLKNMNYVIMR